MPADLYLTDAYLREAEVTVRATSGSAVELESTIFCPTGGGQPHDTGSLRGEGSSRWSVINVEKGPSGISHHLQGPALPPVGARMHAELDWGRRYAHMRYHTLLHILSGVVFRRYQAGITGGQIAVDRARMDFSIPEFDAKLAELLLEEVHQVVREDREVVVRFIPRAEAARDPSLVRVAPDLVPDVDEVRLIDIRGFDVQADGGTHVRRTSEVGHARLLRIENKGARNKRLYLSLPSPGVPEEPRRQG
ncbi:MAG: alanyl-tRNA editing protein [Thermoplasmata archaeon]|nr:alanyl-tRNA editing protein [Thermoplasmata archaeon]